MVVEPSVVNDPARSLNANNGVWSFRHAIEEMLGGSTHTPTEFISSWLEDWASTTQVNNFTTDREPRGEELRGKFLCPWLRSTPENNCNENCSQCTAKNLDLAKAPFRLMGISNRTDLRLRPDTVSPAGESRLLFYLTNGPGDDPASTILPMTLIMEYALPEGGNNGVNWIESWHRLGKHAAFDEAYKQELTTVTEGFVRKNASPSRPNGSALAQIRTNESAFNWIWQLREFRIDGAGNLRLAPVSNTPGEPLNGSTLLRDFAIANADKIKKDEMVLPRSLLAGSADLLLFRWNIPGVDEPVRAAFARATCNGCHAGENPNVDTAFHVSPFRTGVDRLSRFVNNPADPSNDELARRSDVMKQSLCTTKK
jgi:hypothetical protein